MFSSWFEKLKRISGGLGVFHSFAFLFIFLPLLIIVYFAFDTSESTFIQNSEFINKGTSLSIFRSLFIAIVTVIFTFLLGYPFSYFVASIDSEKSKAFLMIFISSPLWSSFFVKLLGLRSFFDLLNGSPNSTYGIIYTIIGLIYVNLPIAILSFYNVVNNIPKNLINAAQDLGSSHFETFLKVILPYTREALVAVFFLVFIPSFTAITVSEFMNNESGSKMVGELLNNFVIVDNNSNIAKSRASFFTLFLATVMFLIYFLVKTLSKAFSKHKND
nr:ABC transporter permease subunit [Mycoplasma haemocanis]